MRAFMLAMSLGLAFAAGCGGSGEEEEPRERFEKPYEDKVKAIEEQNLQRVEDQKKAIDEQSRGERSKEEG